MAKVHVKRGDEVVVISGSARGRRGKITRVFPSNNTVVLEGNDERAGEKEDRRRLVKPVLHYQRKSQQNPNGGLLWLEGSIHASNVMKVEEYDRRKAKKKS